MTRTRKTLLILLAAGSAGLALWVLVAALLAEKLTGQVFLTIMPLVMLFGIAWSKLTEKSEDPKK